MCSCSSSSATRWCDTRGARRGRSIRCNSCRAELVRYPTFDRDSGKIPADSRRSYSGRARRVRTRCYIDIHGGPEAQYTPGFNPFTQFLVREMGFVVITPNVRGSSGYGKTYINLDNGEDREDSVKDIGALLVWIGAQTRPGCEERVRLRRLVRRLHVAGSMVHFSDRLRGGIDVVGISNFVTFLESTSAYRRDLRRAGIRRRTPAAHARLSAEDFAADQRGADREAVAGGAGTQ